MADTYTQIYIHIIFAVRNRSCLIQKDIKDELYKYITGIISKMNCKLIVINGMPDHVHLLVGQNPDVAISKLVQTIKRFSTLFINDKKWFGTKFTWQAGFGAFSYSKSQISKVVNYINNQESHHRVKTFKEEYIELLKKYEVEYNEKYLFDFESL